MVKVIEHSKQKKRDQTIKISKDNFWGFNWLVRISLFNLIILMAFIPFLFFVWLFKVGQLSERKLSLKPDYLFRILLLVFSLGITLSFLISIMGIIPSFDKNYNSIFWLIYLSFIYIDFYITKLTFKVENKNNYSSDISDKVVRFFLLSTLMLGAFFLQPKINKMFAKD